MADKLIRYKPDLGFVVPDVDEYGRAFDPAESFLDCMYLWVMETHPDDIRDNIVVEDA